MPPRWAPTTRNTPAPARSTSWRSTCWGTACAGPFEPEALYREVTSALPYAGLTRRQFDRIVDFVSTGGYALRAYERYARLRPTGDGRLRLSHPRLAQQYRMNAGTIVEAPMIKIRLVGRKNAKGRPEVRLRNPACRAR